MKESIIGGAMLFGDYFWCILVGENRLKISYYLKKSTPLYKEICMLI